MTVTAQVQNGLKVEYRTIAKWLNSYTEQSDNEFVANVETSLHEIKDLPSHQRLDMKLAYIFSRKVPHQERQDVYQDIMAALIEYGQGDVKLLYAIARNVWRTWWRNYLTRTHYLSGHIIQDDGDENDERGNVLAETLVGECDFERKIEGEIEGQRIWAALPKDIKAICKKRLLGKATTATERSLLARWIAKRPMILSS